MKINLDLSKIDDLYTRAMLRKVMDAFKQVPEYTPPSSPLTKFTVKIPATSQFVVCDLIPLDKFVSLKYLINLYKVDQTVVRTFEMSVINKNSSVSETITNSAGDTINYTITTRINTSSRSIEVVIKNLESYELHATLVRVIL